MRTIEVARRVGCSVQHLRNLERAGAVPPATRTPSGYRTWSDLHVLAATAYRELSRAIGPTPARALLQALHRQPAANFLAMLDAAHADLARQRRDVQLARNAVAAITAEPFDAPAPSDSMTIAELANALGTTAATLRHWEAEGLLTTGRIGAGRVRTYTPTQVRDARVAHQLRTAGYPIPQARTVLRALTDAQPTHSAWEAGLALRERQINNRSRALLRASAELHQLLAANAAATEHPGAA